MPSPFYHTHLSFDPVAGGMGSEQYDWPMIEALVKETLINLIKLPSMVSILLTNMGPEEVTHFSFLLPCYHWPTAK